MGKMREDEEYKERDVFTRLPSLVSRPSSSSALRLWSCSMADTIVSVVGGSMKSKERRSLMPMAFSESTVLARLVRWISGTAVESISSRYALSV